MMSEGPLGDESLPAEGAHEGPLVPVLSLLVLVQAGLGTEGLPALAADEGLGVGQLVVLQLVLDEEALSAGLAEEVAATGVMVDLVRPEKGQTCSVVQGVSYQNIRS